eukprot:5299839-Pleurochrysis_carterae.AAC.5
MSRLIAAYDRALSRCRLLTTTATGALLGAAGDATMQAARGTQQEQRSTSKGGMSSEAFGTTPSRNLSIANDLSVPAREIVLLLDWFDVRRAFSFTCFGAVVTGCLLYTSPSPRDGLLS